MSIIDLSLETDKSLSYQSYINSQQQQNKTIHRLQQQNVIWNMYKILCTNMQNIYKTNMFFSTPMTKFYIYWEWRTKIYWTLQQTFNILLSWNPQHLKHTSVANVLGFNFQPWKKCTWKRKTFASSTLMEIFRRSRNLQKQNSSMGNYLGVS